MNVRKIIQEEVDKFLNETIRFNSLKNKLAKLPKGTQLLVQSDGKKRHVYLGGYSESGNPGFYAYKTPNMKSGYFKVFPTKNVSILKIGNEKVQSWDEMQDEEESLYGLDQQVKHRDAYRQDKQYPGIDESEDSNKKLKKTGKKNWMEGDIYEMNVNNDSFIHFTTIENVEKILRSGKLNSGGNEYSSFAISTTFGINTPNVQNSKLNDPQAILFTTSEAPNNENFSEEVTWRGGVKFNDAKHISFEEAKRILDNSPEKLPNKDDDSVVYTTGTLAEGITVYRGYGNNYNSGENPFKWVAVDKGVASNYASFDDRGSVNVEQMEINEPKNVFYPPYKSNTDIKASDLQNILMDVVTKKYKAGSLSIGEAKSISSDIKEYVKVAGENLEKYHTKINKKESAQLLHDVLKELGFDAIGIEETNGEGEKSMTYGLVKEGTQEFGGFDFYEETTDSYGDQLNMRVDMFDNGKRVAYVEFNEFQGKYYIDYIESLVKGKGYGQKIMEYLASKYGYENLERGLMTADGMKMRKKLDKKYNFDYEKHIMSQGDHLKKEEIENIKDPNIKKFMKSLYSKGSDMAWKELIGNPNKGLIEKDVLDKYDLDMNEIADISKWIEGSKTNDNLTSEEVPGPIRDDFEKITK